MPLLVMKAWFIWKDDWDKNMTTIINHVRRNHGLEHATIHMLSAKRKNFRVQGNSDHRGFSLNIYGDVTLEDVETAVYEAHKRMNAGESDLAVHQNCGTVLITTATLAAIASQLAFGFEERRQKQPQLNPAVFTAALPTAVLATIVALIVGRPLGIKIQANHTVEGDLGDLQITNIRASQPNVITQLFRLLLGGAGDGQKTAAYRIETKQ